MTHRVPIAREVIVVDGVGGPASQDYRAPNHTRARRPIYPLDLE